MQEISFRNDILPLKDKLFRLALRITLDRAEAEDVVQDTMIRVWNKRDEWSQFESVEAYCLIVAKNLAIDRSQKKEAQNVEITPEMEEEPDANMYNYAEKYYLTASIRVDGGKRTSRKTAAYHATEGH